MGAFEFEALDHKGKTRRGVLHGDSSRQIRQQLRDKALNPLLVTPVSGPVAGKPGGRLMGGAELALLLRQLGTLLGSAIPLEEALVTIADQSERPATRKLFSALRSSVTEGRSLATAMQDFPRDFPDWVSASIAAGEQSGRLEYVLDRLADYAERRQQTRATVGLTLVYPMVVAVVALVVIAAMMIYVVPRVVLVFEQSQQTLPFLTRALISISSMVQDYGLVLLVAGVVTAGVLGWLSRHAAVRFRWQQMLLRLPLAGRFWRSVNTARFTRTLSLLTGSAVPLVEALPVAARVMPGLPLRIAVSEATAQVREGVPLSKALKQTGIFSPMVLRLVSSGERSGQLEQMLDKAAQSEEQNLDLVSQTMIGLLQPALILLVGVFVLLVVLAIMLPIMSFNQLIA